MIAERVQNDLAEGMHRDHTSVEGDKNFVEERVKTEYERRRKKFESGEPKKNG